MDTHTDWQRELDASFGASPDRPPELYVARGRRAVRRRRAAAAAMAVATVAVVGGGVWATSPGTSARGDSTVATRGPDVVQREVAVSDDDDRDRLDRRMKKMDRMRREAEKAEFVGNPATIVLGKLVLAPGAGPVLEQVPDPMGYAPGTGRTSIGLRVMFEGVEKYSLIASETDDMSSSTSFHTNTASGDFPGWLASKVELQRGLDAADDDAPDAGVVETPDAWLTLGADGSIESATPFVAVMEVRDQVDLGGGFALDADRTGTARLQVAGTERFVAWRVVGGELEVVPGPGSFDSMDAFVTWARQQYASGEGMR